ncbi:MAG TPA: AAA family ATPase [Kofleriaceae bacterium]|nr:AAA family ATPase [Kofleriaceae bacterium]
MDVASASPILGGGRFEVRGTLGSGGAGVVYRVFDRQLGREVALKLLRQASGRDLFRFKREFRALADIVHPSLVALHELHAEGGDWYFTMELVEGVSFIDWVRPGRASGPQRPRGDIQTGRLDEHRLRDALIQLTDALIALHRAGKLHRDLKPSNVLVTRSGRLALLDFGLITGVAEGDPERLAVGTPVYMSPEQASDQPLGEASDWYSVGAMVYEALTGRRPFEGDSEQVMTRKQSETPPHPTRLASRVPPELAKLCMALLHPRAAARPGGAEILGLLGATPSPRTRALARSQPPTAFVGRSGELEELRRALADCHRGGVAVLVVGRSGIGKTTLVRRFLRELGPAVSAVEGRCFEREAVPFKMLDGVVDALTGTILTLPPEQVGPLAPPELGALVRMFPVLLRVPRFAEAAPASPPPPDPQELRRRGFRALKILIAGLARLRPLVIFVDDAHWGDADSAVFLADLIHGSEPGVLVIAAHRPDDYLGVVAQLRRPPGGSALRGDVRELEVAALGEAHAAELVTQLAADARRVAAAVTAAAGNPLVLVELARAPRLEPGARIDDLVRARARQLGPDAQAMLVATSVAGRPLPVEIAARAAEVAAGLDAAAQLATERLATLRQVGEQAILHPAHDHIRAAMLAELDDAARARWHEALARAYEGEVSEGGAGADARVATTHSARELDAEAVALHWLAAGHAANAARHAVAAALKAERSFAFRRAAELYEIAIAHGPWDAAERRDLLRYRAHALVCAGQLDEAAEAFGRAAALVADADAAALERLRVEALLRRGRVGEALPVAERLLAQLGLSLPLATRAGRLRLTARWLLAKPHDLDFTERAPADVPAAQLRVVDVLCSISSGLAFADPGLGRAAQLQLLRAALDAGEPHRVCLALALEVCYAGGGGSRNRAAIEETGARLSALALRLGHTELIGIADVARGVAAHLCGQWRDARGHLEAGLAMLREHASVRWEIDVGDMYWLPTLFYVGDWREMTRQTQLLLRDAIDRADVVAQQNLRTGRCNLAWLLAHRPAEAREQLAIAERSIAATAAGAGAAAGAAFLFPHAQAVIAAVHIELYVGDGAAAARRLAEAWGDLERLGCLRLQQLRIELSVLRARAALATLPARNPSEARIRPIRALADDLMKEGAEWASALGHLVRASLHAFRGESAAARAELLAAEALLVGAGMMGLLQIARLRRGLLEGGAGGTARAEAARDMMRELGAVEPESVAALLVPWPGSWPH